MFVTKKLMAANRTPCSDAQQTTPTQNEYLLSLLASQTSRPTSLRQTRCEDAPGIYTAALDRAAHSDRRRPAARRRPHNQIRQSRLSPDARKTSMCPLGPCIRRQLSLALCSGDGSGRGISLPVSIGTATRLRRPRGLAVRPCSAVASKQGSHVAGPSDATGVSVSAEARGSISRILSAVQGCRTRHSDLHPSPSTGLSKYRGPIQRTRMDDAAELNVFDRSKEYNRPHSKRLKLEKSRKFASHCPASLSWGSPHNRTWHPRLATNTACARRSDRTEKPTTTDDAKAHSEEYLRRVPSLRPQPFLDHSSGR